MKKIILIIFLIIIFCFFYFHNQNLSPSITLKGKKIITLNLGETYKEEGFKATYKKDGDITDLVKIKQDINYDKPGTYQITYSVTYKKIKAQNQRYIKIKENQTYKENYNKIDNTVRNWWPGNKLNYERPTLGAGAKEEELIKYNAYYMGKDKKVIYLTFDEGSLNTYVSEILEVLNNNNVKATFFFCKNFMVKNPELINKIVNSGHSIGNHTANHLSMPSLANSKSFTKYTSEIKEVENVFYKITGKQMDKIYREPRGEYSFRSLKIISDFGYKTFFWSASYLDFNGELSYEKALKNMKERYHNGAIYLIHPNNKGNYLALNDFIQFMKEKGFTFDLVKNIK